MRGNADASSILEQILDSGNRSADAGVVGDGLAIKRDVEVASDENLRSFRYDTASHFIEKINTDKPFDILTFPTKWPLGFSPSFPRGQPS